MKKLPLTVSILFAVIFSVSTMAQTALTNDDVVKLLKAGLSTNVITAKIKSTSGKYDTSVEALARLKADNVPEDVILAMIEANTPKLPSTAMTLATPVDPIASAQHGQLSELRQKFNVFILTDNLTSRNFIVGELAKYAGLHVVGTEQEADFLIAFVNTAQTTGASVSGGLYSAQARTDYKLTGEMVAATRISDPAHPLRIYWSTRKIQDTTNGWTFNRAPEVNATRELIQAFKKMRGEAK